jgi:hypothetical protein
VDRDQKLTFDIKGKLAWEECVDDGRDDHARNLLLLKENLPEKSVWTMAEMNMAKTYFWY